MYVFNRYAVLKNEDVYQMNSFVKNHETHFGITKEIFGNFCPDGRGKNVKYIVE